MHRWPWAEWQYALLATTFLAWPVFSASSPDKNNGALGVISLTVGLDTNCPYGVVV
jgi:hypothetical protein